MQFDVKVNLSGVKSDILRLKVTIGIPKVTIKKYGIKMRYNNHIHEWPVFFESIQSVGLCLKGGGVRLTGIWNILTL